MKILIATRLFSALEESVRSGAWQPRGIPAIYKLIEKLDNDPDLQLDVILAGKKNTDTRKSGTDKMILPPLKSNFYFLPFFSGIIAPLKFLLKITPRAAIINEMHQAVKIIFRVATSKYDLIYIDRVHVGAGFVCARILKKNVILRLLGIYKEMFDLADAKRSPLAFLTKLCYAAPYKHVICTQDGSGGEQFIPKMIKKGVPSEILFNGVETPPPNSGLIREIKKKHRINNKNHVLLFVGKLEDYKGCREFVLSLIALAKINAAFHGVIVGDGALKNELEKMASDAGLQEKISFAGSVRHEAVPAYLAIADICVSLNREGNLSNTVLEAIKSGKCIVRLASSQKERKDLYTDEILEEKYAPRVSRDKTTEELPAILAHLIENPDMIISSSAKMREIAEKHLWNWNKRIEYEIRLIKECAKSK